MKVTVQDIDQESPLGGHGRWQADEDLQGHTGTAHLPDLKHLYLGLGVAGTQFGRRAMVTEPHH